MKFWLNKDQKEDKIIIITKDVFYTYSPSEKDFFSFRNELQLGTIPEKISGIKFSRIRRIDFKEGVSRIEIYYDKKDTLSVLVSSLEAKNEIKEALETEGTKFLKRELTQETFFEKSYKNCIGFGITLLLTYSTFEIATGMQNGQEYEGAGLGAILIAFAEYMGIIGTLVIGSLFFLVIMINLVLKLKDKAPIERFQYK